MNIVVFRNGLYRRGHNVQKYQKLFNIFASELFCTFWIILGHLCKHYSVKKRNFFLNYYY